MSKDITTKINNLLDHGMTPQQIAEECGIESRNIMIDLVDHAGWAKKNNITRSEESFVLNMRTLDAFNKWYEEKVTALESKEDDTPAEDAATTRQVAFITKLIGEGRQVAGQPTEWDDVAKLSKREASAYIDRLLKSPKVTSINYSAKAQAIGESYGVNGGIWDDM